jgi:hypothetical protein
MKAIKILTFVAVLGLGATGCSKQFSEYEMNNNKPLQTPPGLVLTGILSNININSPWSDVMRWNQFDACNYNYYGNQRYDWGGAKSNDYYTLSNVLKMESEAKRLGGAAVNPYAALGKFFKAFLFYRMTVMVGDLPMTEALKGKDNLYPVYDDQKAIFLQILKWLDEANTDLTQLIVNPDKSNTSVGQILSNDFYFGNNLENWQRTVNTLRLRVLISLSMKTADAELKVGQQFADVVNNPAKYPLMTSIQQNMQYNYNNINKYPINPDNLGNDATRYNMSATYLNRLVSLNDPRAYITAEPATQQLKNGKTPADITAYVGAESGESLDDMSSKMADAVNGAYSLRSRSRYYSGYSPEPQVYIGYAEMCFNIAEAINRSWITGDAEDWYKKGIRASLSFYGVPVDAPGNVTKAYGGTNYTIPFNFEAVYYQQPSVKYAGNNATGLAQILTQKYLAFFQGSDFEAYLNWRRTGVPVFSVGAGTGNNGVIPMRFKYPDSHRASNEKNWKDAVQKQFGSGVDDINAKMWMIK